jgi:uncharacterized protein
MDLIFYLIIFLLSFGVMFIAALSGGVSLMLRPILYFLGVPPLTVVATMRTTILAELPGLFVLHKNNKINWKLALFMAIPYSIGTIIMSFVILSLPVDIVEFCIGVFLILVGVSYIFLGEIGSVERKSSFSSKMSHTIGFFGTIIISMIGTITGGMGPIYTTLYIWVYGKDFIKAAAVSKVATYIGGLIGVVIFILSGYVDWILYIPITLGLLSGSYFGAIYGLKKGTTWVKYIIIIMSLLGGIKLIWF